MNLAQLHQLGVLPPQPAQTPFREAKVTLDQATTAKQKAISDLRSVAAQIAESNQKISNLAAQIAPFEKVGAHPPRALIDEAARLKREAVELRAKYKQQSIIGDWTIAIERLKRESQAAQTRKDYATAALKEGAAQVYLDAINKFTTSPVKVKLPPAPKPAASAPGVHGLGALGTWTSPLALRTWRPTVPQTSMTTTHTAVPVKPPTTPAKSFAQMTPAERAARFRKFRESGIVGPHGVTAIRAAMNQEVKDLAVARTKYPAMPSKYCGKGYDCRNGEDVTKLKTPPSDWANKSQWTVGLNPVQLNVLNWAPPPNKKDKDGKDVEDGSTSLVIAAMQAIPPDRREQWFFDTYILHSDAIGGGGCYGQCPQWVVDLQSGNLGRHGFVGFLQDAGDWIVENAGTIAEVAAFVVAAVIAIPTGGLSLAAAATALTAGAGAAATAGAIAHAAAPLQKEVESATQGTPPAMTYAPQPGAPTAEQYLAIKAQQAAAAGQPPPPTASGQAPAPGQPGSQAAQVAGPQPQGALFIDPTSALAQQPLPPVSSFSAGKTVMLGAGGLALLGVAAFAMKRRGGSRRTEPTPTPAPHPAPAT